MKFKVLALLALTIALLVPRVYSGTKAQWKQRTIYQVLTDRFWRTDGSTRPCYNLNTYCGGTWKGMMNKLDYIKGMGFDAIWISPVPKNRPDGYHGYWQSDFTKVNEHFGTEQDLKNLVNAAHSKGIWVMLDVVANHVGFVPGGMDFSVINPFNKPEHYHDYCIIQKSDFRNNQYRVEHCRLDGLPDLNQENPFVRSYLKQWIKGLIQKFKFDGIRIDTIPEVEKPFWKEFTDAAGVFTIGECLDDRVSFVAGYQGKVSAMLNYPLYFSIVNVYAKGNSMYQLRTEINAIKKTFPDASVLGNFIDNHDHPRFLALNSYIKRTQNALAFVLFTEGIPIVYYGTEQGYAGRNDPDDREPLWSNLSTNGPLYGFIRTLVKYRKKMRVWNYPYVERYVNNELFAFSRGKVFVVTTVSNIKGFRQAMKYIPYKDGEVVCNVLYQTDCLKITNGILEVVLNYGETKVFVPKSML